MKINIILLFFCYSLKISGQTTKVEFQKQLNGSWQWFKTEIVDRGGGSIKTPITCFCTRRLNFRNDIVDEYENDTLIRTFNYNLVDVNIMKDPPQFNINGKYLSGQIVIWNDTLGIGPFGGCGFLQFFKRY